MSHREHVRYVINASSKNYMSVTLANDALSDCHVGMIGNNELYVFGELDAGNITVLKDNFEIYDDIDDGEVLSLLEE